VSTTLDMPRILDILSEPAAGLQVTASFNDACQPGVVTPQQVQDNFCYTVLCLDTPAPPQGDADPAEALSLLH
jgi:hypothetical protein